MTVADHEAEELITEALLAAYPDAVVLGEEAYAGDPALMSGTPPPTTRSPSTRSTAPRTSCTGPPTTRSWSAETRGGEAVRAWIWQPQHERAYIAERGAGAWLNGEPLVRPARPATPGSGAASPRAAAGWAGTCPGSGRSS